ncbi:MAG: hypothetical protein QOE71_2664, partial [Pseudonocardiales bacterium]|nr:hypothetical protein [Pseudonocardiales bacterium]
APLCDALAELIHGDADRATDHLLELADVDRLGGSAAQREVIEETLLLAAVQAERHELARSLLSERLERRESPRDRRRLADALNAEATPAEPA